MNNFFREVIVSDYFKNMESIIKKNKEIGINIKFKSKIPYPLKQYYNPIIPLNIYQTWHTKQLPELMQKHVDMLIFNNPAFKHYLYDDDDCRDFIKNNFNNIILNAFDSLIPGAYKADLFRYCILYKQGGIYMDIKYTHINNFKFINLTEREHFVLDVDNFNIYNALMVCLPNNPILLNAINKIVENVKNKYYGSSSLDPTGPGLLGSIIPQNVKNKIIMNHINYLTCENKYIFLNGYLVLRSYNGYGHEQNTYQKTAHYSQLWTNRAIYKD
jgi:mannosyltransferase OCH1-like enzyme